MIIQIDTGPGYTSVFNLMHHMFFPVKDEVYDAGIAYERAEELFYTFAKDLHDNTNPYSAEAYAALMSSMDEAKRNLKPYMNEWYMVRHGIGLN